MNCGNYIPHRGIFIIYPHGVFVKGFFLALFVVGWYKWGCLPEPSDSRKEVERWKYLSAYSSALLQRSQRVLLSTASASGLTANARASKHKKSPEKWLSPGISLLWNFGTYQLIYIIAYANLDFKSYPNFSCLTTAPYSAGASPSRFLPALRG